MRLIRRGNSYCDEALAGPFGSSRNNRFGDPLSKKACWTSECYGNGREPHSHFDAEVEWADVEDLIDTFATMGHPGAIHIRALKLLAEAKETLAAEPEALEEVQAA